MENTKKHLQKRGMYVPDGSLFVKGADGGVEPSHSLERVLSEARVHYGCGESQIHNLTMNMSVNHIGQDWASKA